MNVISKEKATVSASKIIGREIEIGWVRGYVVVKTLVNSKGMVVDADGCIDVDPKGYVIRDNKTGDLTAVTRLELSELSLKGEVDNAVAIMQQKNGKFSVYVESRRGHAPLKEKSMVANISGYIKDHPEIEVSVELAKDIMKIKIKH